MPSTAIQHRTVIGKNYYKHQSSNGHLAHARPHSDATCRLSQTTAHAHYLVNIRNTQSPPRTTYLQPSRGSMALSLMLLFTQLSIYGRPCCQANALSTTTDHLKSLYPNLSAFDLFSQNMSSGGSTLNKDVLFTQQPAHTKHQRFHSANAALREPPIGAITWNAHNDIYIVSDKSSKDRVIRSLKDHLVASGQLTADAGGRFERFLLQQALGSAVVVAPRQIPVQPIRLKRESFADKEQRITQHIETHCAVEIELLDNEENNEGEILLLRAQRAENPFRMIYDSNKNSKNPSPLQLGAAIGLNTAIDIITLGIKPFISALIANNIRKQYYQDKADEICAVRQDHISFATVATFFDISGLSYPARMKTISRIPKELLQSLPLPERAAYNTRNRHSGIQRELLIEVDIPDASIGESSKILLKPNGAGEFVTWHPHAVNPEFLQRRVIIDEKTLSWRFADTFDAAALNVEIIAGKKFIVLYNQKYELHMNRHKQYEIVVNNKSGVRKYIPVYREPLSNTWHMKVHNTHPAFKKWQQKVIDRAKVPFEKDKHYHAIDNLRPEHYGQGKIFEVRHKNSDIYQSQPLYYVVEMNSCLVPVRHNIVQGHGVNYEIYNMKGINPKGHAIEWSGNRWLFERASSLHISRQLKKMINQKFDTANLDAGRLSAPDHQGLRWDTEEHAYLKVKNKFLQVFKLISHPVNINRRYLKRADGSHVYLRYRDDKFHLETMLERIDTIKKMGFGGKRYTPEDYLVEAQGGIDSPQNRRWANEMLANYNFPTTALHNDLEFALHYFEWGQIPPWAHTYKTSGLQRVNVFDRSGNSHTLRYFREAPLGSGVEGDVYPDGMENYLVKVYHTENNLDSVNDASVFFNRYYGIGASTVYHNKDAVFMRMRKITGKPLSQVIELPPDAITKFDDMIHSLSDKHIYHADLKPDNVLWDKLEKKFKPIDFGVDSNDYSRTLPIDDLFDRMKYEASDSITLIQHRIETSGKDTQ